MSDEVRDAYDVVVIGGGAAGLNGALMLARSRRTVLVVDAGQPRNRPAAAVHGLLGHDGVSPAELLARGRDEVRRYGGEVITGEVITGEIITGEVIAGGPDADGGLAAGEFALTLADGRRVRARRLLVASGLVDELPDVPGLRERWGRDVVHCPYCHGWEVRDRAIGVLATGPMSVHQALLFRQLSDDVVYFANKTALDEAQAAQLAARGIRMIDGRVSALVIDDDRLAGVRLADGGVVPREVIAVGARMVARAGFLRDLGLRASAHPSGMGEHIAVDAAGRTEVAGVWAAGNVTDLSAQVGAAAAAGAFAGAQINADLVAEEARLAVAKAVAQAIADTA
jgi:thioredoxin reductase